MSSTMIPHIPTSPFVPCALLCLIHDAKHKEIVTHLNPLFQCDSSLSQVSVHTFIIASLFCNQ